MRHPNLPRWLALTLTLLIATAAIGDGKTFIQLADPLADVASSTMPRQRAIIAWDGAVQHMAIDTAFTGEGTEFAWLVPLPSTPEITPATKGMFDTAAVLTAPRVRSVANTDLLLSIGFLGFVLFLAITLSANSITRAAGVCVGTAAFLVLAGVMLPVVGNARSSQSPPSTVRIVDRDVAGLYETTVLKADNADRLIGWLVDNGYGVPDGVGPVVQDYLDRGWCFAAATIGVDSQGDVEHRAHPLAFRFATGEPVYPMALTAVGNHDIELELFVFAQAAASAQGLRRTCSHAYVSADPQDTSLAATLRPRRPRGVAHPRLVGIAGEGGVLTRLHGVLGPEQQRDDITIRLTRAGEHDPLHWTPQARTERAATVALFVAVGGSIVFLVVRSVQISRRRARLDWGTLAGLVAIGLLGGVAGGVTALSTRVHTGAITSGRELLHAGMILRDFARSLPVTAEVLGASGEADLREALLQSAAEEYFSHIHEGDGPLHYRFEPTDSGDGVWFIWHDAIGGEHRVRASLAQKNGEDHKFRETAVGRGL